MLNERKITITEKCMIEDKEITNFIAILNTEKSEVSFGERQLDKEACMEHRDVVRADRSEFEDFAYSMLLNTRAAK